MALRVLCCGDRDWADWAVILERLSLLPRETIVIEGECRGADKMCKAVAKELGFKVIPFRAKWTTYGRAAGPIRNQLMLDEGKPDLVIAFHTNIEMSKGTAGMIALAKKAGVPTELVTGD